MYSESWSGWSSWTLVASMQILWIRTGRLWAGGTCRWNSRCLGGSQIPFAVLRSSGFRFQCCFQFHLQGATFEWSVPPSMAAQKPEECVVWGQNAIVVVAYGLMFATRLQWKAGGCWDIAVGCSVSIGNPEKPSCRLTWLAGDWLVGKDSEELWEIFRQNGGLESSPVHGPRHSTIFMMWLTTCRIVGAGFEIWAGIQDDIDTNISEGVIFLGGWPWVTLCPWPWQHLGGWTEILSSLIMLILLGTCYVAARESMIPGWIGIQPPSLETKIEAWTQETWKLHALPSLLQTQEPVSWSFFSFSRSNTDSRKKMMHTGTVANLEDPWIAGRVWWVSTDVDPMFWRPEL